MPDGLPLAAPSIAAQPPSSATELLADLASRLDLARNQFRARQLDEASTSANKLIEQVHALASGATRFSEEQSASAKCFEACALTLNGRCAEDRGRLEDARRMWEDSVRLFAENREKANLSLDMLGYYGAALRMTGDRKAAIAIFEQIIESGAAVPETYRHYGLALKDEGRYAEAEQQLSKAVEIAPSDFRSWRGLAETLEHLPGEENRQRAAAAYLSLAKGLSSTGNYAAALEAIEQSVRLNPADRDGTLLHADLLRTLGRIDEAMAIVDGCLAEAPDDAIALAIKGAAFYMLGNHPGALQCLERALAVNPEYEWAVGLKGTVLSAVGEFQAAADALLRALEINPSSWAAASELARVYFLLGQPEQACEAAQRALKLKPEDPFTLSLLGLALTRLQRFEDSLQAFDRAIKNNREYDFAWSRRALPLMQLGRQADTAETLERAIELNAKDYWSHWQWGNLLAGSEDPKKQEQAVPELKRALELTDDYEVAADIARVLESLDRLEDAVSAADKAIRLNAHALTAYDVKAGALSRLNRFEEALAAIDSGLQLAPDSATLLARRGQLLHDLQRNEEAEAVLKAAISQDKSLVNAWGDLAEVMYDLQRFEDALSAINTVLELVPGSTRALVLKGFILHELGRDEEAEAPLRAAVTADKSRLGAWQTLGEVLYELKRPEEAVAAVEEVLRYRPNDEQALNCKARALVDIGENLLAKGDPAAAIDRFDEALSIRPQYAYAHADRGAVLHSMGKNSEAAEALKRAVELYPTLAWARSELASTYRDLEQPEDGLKEIEAALNLVPNAPVLLLQKGQLLHDLERNEEAEAALKAAISEDKTLVNAWGDLAEVTYELQRFEDALSAINTVLELAPDSTRALVLKGFILHELGRNEEAEGPLRAAITADKSRLGAWQKLGEVLYELKRPEEAIPALEEVLQYRPNDERALDYKARALVDIGENLLAKGDDAGAIERVDEALSIRPQYAYAHAVRGSVLHVMGKNSEAAEALNTAVKIYPKLAWAHAELSSTYRDLEKPQEALAAIEEALQYSQDYAAAMEIKARIFLDIGEYELAVPLCESALKLRDDIWTPHYWRGVALDNLGRLEEAREAYEQAHSKSPEDIWPRSALADILAVSNSREAALQEYEWIISQMPAQNRGLVDLMVCGWCHYGCDRLDLAIRLYSEAAALDPDQTLKTLHFDLALIIGCSKRYGRAKREYERAIEIALTAHPWLRKAIFTGALKDLKRAMIYRYPHLNDSPDIRECSALLEEQYRVASEDATRPFAKAAIRQTA